jgi:hypothetical protein
MFMVVYRHSMFMVIRRFWLDRNIYMLAYNIICAFVVGLTYHNIVTTYTSIKHICLSLRKRGSNWIKNPQVCMLLLATSGVVILRRVLRHDPIDPVLSQLARTGVVEALRITFKHHQSYKQQSITLVTMVTSTPQERELDLGPIQELFTFSPFGLGCQECKINVPIRMDERCIRDHLK